MLARSRGVPMVVGLGGDPTALVGEVLVDAIAGEVVINPGQQERRRFEARRREDLRVADEAIKSEDKPAITRDGVVIAVHLNVSDPEELARLERAACDGIGLVRTEFLFANRGGLPDEETASSGGSAGSPTWAAGKPVTIWTLDAGGDKPIEGLTVDNESNPFLGLRGIRLSLCQAASVSDPAPGTRARRSRMAMCGSCCR